jgi:crossover junction endodeoxyribonuclease RusA
MLPLPPSVNQMYRLKVVAGVAGKFKTKSTKDFESDAGNEILAQRVGQPSIDKLIGSLQMTVYLYFKDRRRRDIDNCLKVLQDTVSDVLGFDDSRIGELHVYRRFDKSNPRAEVRLERTGER